MAEFIDISLGRDYLEVYCKFRNQKGFIFVEGLADIRFWDRIVNSKKVGAKYAVYHASENGTRGKPVLKKMMAHANEFALLAMDSDFDYVCPNNSEDAIKINAHKYILQTGLYSKESVIYDPIMIQECISNFQVIEKVNFNIDEYLKKFSNAIYNVLLRFLFIKEKRLSQLDDASFHNGLTPDPARLNNEYLITNDTLARVREFCNKTLTEYDTLIASYNYERELDEFQTTSLSKGLDIDSAYKYINGHVLEDNIVLPILNALISKLIEKEVSKIVVECKRKPKLIEERRKEITNIIHNDLKLETIINICSSTTSNKTIDSLKKNPLLA